MWILILTLIVGPNIPDRVSHIGKYYTEKACEDQKTEIEANFNDVYKQELKTWTLKCEYRPGTLL